MFISLRMLLTAALFALAGAPVFASPITVTLAVDGVDRQALVYAPPAVPTAAAAPARPIIFAFHGHGGNMQGTANMMRFQDYWPEAIVVYPQGVPTPGIKMDPQGLKPGWQSQAGENGDRDLHFFDALLSKLEADYRVDTKHIFSAGFSHGALFTFLLWAERGSEIAAYATAEGAILPPLQLTLPRSLMSVSGRNDPLVLFADQMQTVETVRTLDGATGAGQTCGSNCTHYTGAGNVNVVTLIHNGGHIYPPAASPLIVKFFKGQSLP